jgi:hypothetical protein
MHGLYPLLIWSDMGLKNAHDPVIDSIFMLIMHPSFMLLPGQ